jgi:hypothetical protein
VLRDRLARTAELPCQIDDRVVLAAELGVLADARGAALERQQQHRGAPAVIDAAEHLGDGHARVGEEHLAELAGPAHLLERPGLDAGLVHVDEKHRDAPVAFRTGIRSDQRKDLVALHGVGGPHLLAVDEEAV